MQHSSTQALVYHVPSDIKCPGGGEDTQRRQTSSTQGVMWLVTQRDNNYDNYDTLYTQPYIIHSVNVHHYYTLKIIILHCTTTKDLPPPVSRFNF